MFLNIINDTIVFPMNWGVIGKAGLVSGGKSFAEEFKRLSVSDELPNRLDLIVSRD